MPNKNQKAIDILSDQIINAVKTVCSKLEFDKTHIGVISEITTNGYIVKYNGTDIKIKTKETSVFKKGDTVKICIPCGNKRKAYIVVDLDMAMKLVNKSKTTETNTENI